MTYKILVHKTLPDTFGCITSGEIEDSEIWHTHSISKLFKEETTIELLVNLYRFEPLILKQLEDYELKTVELKIID